MQEVWKFHNQLVYLICEWACDGNYTFTVKPANLAGV